MMAWYWWLTVAIPVLLPVAGLLVGVAFMLVALPFMRLLPDCLARRYAINLFIAGDQLINAIWGGDPDMTCSGRMGGRLLKGRKGCRFCYWLAAWICDLLDEVDPDHCIKAFRADPKEGKRGLFRG